MPNIEIFYFLHHKKSLHFLQCNCMGRILFDAVFCIFYFGDLFLKTSACHTVNLLICLNVNVPNIQYSIWLFLQNEREWKYSRYEQPNIWPVCAFYILRSEFVWEKFWHTAFWFLTIFLFSTLLKILSWLLLNQKS